jgi:glycerol uptake facilitator-like aquaporin
METGVFKHQKKLMPLVLFYELCGSALVTYAFSLGSQDYAVRGIALMIGWIIASTISGAHFNPAVSLAVYLY